jgi:hypothetical protein
MAVAPGNGPLPPHCSRPTVTSLLESFDSFNVHAIFLDWALQLMYVHNQLMIVISSSSMVATLGMGAGPSKLW